MEIIKHLHKGESVTSLVLIYETGRTLVKCIKHNVV